MFLLGFGLGWDPLQRRDGVAGGSRGCPRRHYRGEFLCSPGPMCNLGVSCVRRCVRWFLLEVVMTTPGVLEVIEDLCRSYPSLTFGVGTVLNAADARKAIEAGAQFLMSPGTVLDILHDLEESNVLYIPGVLTPTEVLSACSAGAKVVKVYPVSVMGGEAYMSALKKPFPVVPMVASQGIKIGSIKGYMEAGASAVVLSDTIFDNQLMKDRKFSKISELANLATLEALQFTK
ncbi:uncharacterized protein LOC8069103 isoform X2 [Sorghum bicolor]|uniref:uncharacterized protein LOC8069103 isoform X2 n=1 Tax=Sorghum bicolor TaxID=4558 RepID=UPI000B4242B4|nr:uncharacterized protein LOC8069103 isoform X2 [Sorghum bicolor]|eukprot:XP_021308625.1 uncharacterized protein LOC8069103 isoform X2 [Sorghum bicolor]